jgi:hypothetical protein
MPLLRYDVTGVGVLFLLLLCWGQDTKSSYPVGLFSDGSKLLIKQLERVEHARRYIGTHQITSINK